jgi:hypothetical protein
MDDVTLETGHEVVCEHVFGCQVLSYEIIAFVVIVQNLSC